MLSRKDDIGKNIHELERIKRALGKHAILTYN
jgi:hypothetical protein